MYISKSFVLVMGAVMVFLLVAFATEEAQCIARARQLLREMTRPLPANIDQELACEPADPALPPPGQRRRPVLLSPDDSDAERWIGIPSPEPVPPVSDVTRLGVG